MSIPTRRSGTNTNTAGSKDLSFGNTTPKTGETFFSQISGISRSLANGSVITVGVCYFENAPYIAVFKHTAEGEVDPNYQPVFIPATDFVELFNLVIQPDGRPLLLFALGSAQIAMAVRFNVDGTTDSSFGDGGTRSLNTRIYPGLLPRSGLAVQPDGKILVAFRNLSNSFIFQLDSDGTIINFGQQGPITLNGTILTSLILTSQGFVVGGYRGNQTLALGFDANGNPDSGFGNNGEVVLAQDNLAISDMASGPQGSIGVVGTDRYSPQERNFITKLQPNGTPSQDFHQGNLLITDTGLGSYTDVVFQSDGKMVALARAEAKGRFVNLIRHTLTGLWDNTFGVDGVAEAYRDPQGRPLSAYVTQLELVQPNDKLQTSGYVSGGSYIARSLSD
ncbi:MULTISPECIES: hypothetical protein [Pseudomonas]|uniref:Delta-60 repeat domain-containing protein n=1 Tax=Pseudomonas fluorescens LMG 5329 TaxID=1324332 RepID=A0A0A1YUR4_PSEFL|nr:MULTISPECIES: hypothetical protein [Pseudomonas]KGE64714.1 hypothetical protein K814_0127940 [Pseudomonas fluorescens LMG 5329]NWE01218.1 hypothetical protein [Pseudomonas sp. IPO3749]NWF21654.1 hypothetical protein [Pseudomonas sp. IPO3749]